MQGHTILPWWFYKKIMISYTVMDHLKSSSMWQFFKEVHLRVDQQDQADHHYHGHPVDRQKNKHYSIKTCFQVF